MHSRNRSENLNEADLKEIVKTNKCACFKLLIDIKTYLHNYVMILVLFNIKLT